MNLRKCHLTTENSDTNITVGDKIVSVSQYEKR